MIPASFAYHAPQSVAEAVSLLEQHGDEAKILAGGHSLLPALKLRLSQPGVLIDISRIGELQGIHVGSSIEIGAGATYAAVAGHAGVRSGCAVLAECVEQIGDIQVRNRGTVGGALAHADPAADLPAVLLALGGSVSAQGPGGSRTIAADDLFVEMLTTALEPNEVVTKVTVPALGKGEGAAYSKLKHPASRYAIVGVAAYVKLAADGSVAAARIAVTGAGPKAERQSAAEAALVGSAGDDAAVAAAAAAAGDDMEYLGDIHASEDYRRAMVKVYTRRAVAAALSRARA
ncbi:MAG TPA: xanthine dehydrogenase family protein subunit M [Roseiflexaceae bacterium]|nr:xanthine dehydrogenase family protein subunit M [Roseiflexaceae bacterium]HMP39772.1 xanthine dehydrogenase family protein subunit M [Roseiflexaceae bacterium]